MKNLDLFIKVAFKYNKPQHFKKFHLMDDEELFQGALRQLMARKFMSVLDNIPGINSAEKFKFRRDLTKQVKNNSFGSIGGTIFPAKKPNGKTEQSIGISRDLFNGAKQSKDGRKYVNISNRNILAHEAFHANTPILGKSEILAHLYGGFRSRNWKEDGPHKMFAHLAKGRPVRFGIEAGIGLGTAAGLGYLGKKLYNKYKKKKK